MPIWVRAKPNRPATGYEPDQTDQRLGLGQTKQTKDREWARLNWRNSGMYKTEQTQFKYGPDRTDAIQI